MRTIDVERLGGLLGDLEYETKVLALRALLQQSEPEEFVPGVSKIWNLATESNQELREICRHLRDHVTQHFYDSRAYILDVKLLRHDVCGPSEATEGAFLWHSDNHPPSTLNLIVYLTDVGVGDGGMQYIKKGNAVLRRPYSRPYGGKVLESEVEKLSISSDYFVETLLGGVGSAFIFDNCIFHRASCPENSERDVLLIQLGSRQDLLKTRARRVVRGLITVPMRRLFHPGSARLSSLCRTILHSKEIPE